MLTNLQTTIALSVAEIICIIIIIILRRKVKKSKLKTAFVFLTISSIITCTGTLLQNFLSIPLNIKPVYFEYFTYIGNVSLSMCVLLVGVIYNNPKFKLRMIHMVFAIIPIISLLLLWTNEIHNLMYKEYSIYLSGTKFGEFFTIYNTYSIALIGIGIALLIYNVIKSSRFFSKQTVLIITALVIPITTNIIATNGVIDSTIYITPITFSISILLIALAMFKYKLFRIAPIALQRIVDRISDSYLILNEDEIITDYNKTFLTTFKIRNNRDNIRGKDIEIFLKENNLYFDLKKLKEKLSDIKDSTKTVSYELYINKLDKHFRIEVSSIYAKNQSLGILILFKDITQHKKDMEIIQNNQSMLIERERLASLGQMIGGVAHNLKTPIMSIAGAAEGISDLIKEYELSVGNPQVTVEDHHAIAKDMSEWVEKIKTYTEYMSDIITAVKGQAVNFSEEEIQDFTIDEIVKRVNILMKHELKHAVVYLNTEIKCNSNINIKGNINSLVQVINNMISNAIQAYNGEPEKQIDMIVDYIDKKVIISIKDYGPGLPDKVKDKLFKEMITTKGKNGSGLGLYMSYSNIKAHFRGDIKVETEKGKGTKFDIIIPA